MNLVYRALADVTSSGIQALIKLINSPDGSDIQDPFQLSLYGVIAGDKPLSASARRVISAIAAGKATPKTDLATYNLGKLLADDVDLDPATADVIVGYLNGSPALTSVCVVLNASATIVAAQLTNESIGSFVSGKQMPLIVQNLQLFITNTSGFGVSASTKMRAQGALAWLLKNKVLMIISKVKNTIIKVNESIHTISDNEYFIDNTVAVQIYRD